MEEPFIKKYILNDKIRASEVRLIGAEGGQIGVVPIEEAKRISKDESLDLLLISGDTKPPVCKLVNFGQYKYEQSKKERLAKKSSKTQVLKELKLSLKISEHDYQVRVNLGKKFLEKKYKVKIAVFFKGRENARKDLGKGLIQRYIEDLADYGKSTGEIGMGPRSIYTILGPK